MENSTSNILVVEDNRAMCRVIQVILEKAGHSVTCTYDGESAWHAAQNKTFDLIITDQQMPRMSGVELCQKLRSEERYQRTPLIILTAKGLELDLVKLKNELGVEQVFAKPFSPAKVSEVVEQYLSQPTT